MDRFCLLGLAEADIERIRALARAGARNSIFIDVRG
jgi:hypothetical protein